MEITLEHVLVLLLFVLFLKMIMDKCGCNRVRVCNRVVEGVRTDLLTRPSSEPVSVITPVITPVIPPVITTPPAGAGAGEVRARAQGGSAGDKIATDFSHVGAWLGSTVDHAPTDARHVGAWFGSRPAAASRAAQHVTNWFGSL